ncbi:MAG TPA: enoyl-CoA hydratase/isomerase family protein [Candidatus Dormibacteraeota bacterium]|nr:enoyl-CoA hydratase/isomerase family protein [Candidatus Dormibacteraeota bacterium]
MEHATASAKVVSVSKEQDGVALIHLNRPPVNSYDRRFIDDLNQAIDEVRFDESIAAAVLTSDLPKFFSAGADISMFRAVTPKVRAMTILHMHEVLLKMEHTPKIFIAAIAGHALGGGLEITLATDFRFAAEGDYRLGVPEVTLGLLPGNGGTQRLPRLIGRQKAMELLLTGKPLDPKTAAALGVVDRLVPADRLLPDAVGFAASLAAGPTVAIGEIKLAARQGAEMSLEGALALERGGIFRLFETADAKEGMDAFAQKRKPTWKGE